MSVLREKGSWRSQEGRKGKTPPPLPITRAPFLLRARVEVRSLQAPVLLPLGAFSLRFPSEAVSSQRPSLGSAVHPGPRGGLTQ